MDDQILDDSSRAGMPVDMMEPEGPKPWYKSAKVILSAIGAVILIAAIGLYFVWGRSSTVIPGSNNVTLLIKGPDAVQAGSDAEFHILYRNGEDADLTNVHLDLIYPANFQFKSSVPASKSNSGQSFDLPIVRSDKDAELIIRGKLTGATGEQKQILAKLHYELSNFNSNFTVEQTFVTTIQAPNLTFDVSGPSEVPAGQDTTFTLNYSNVSKQDYDNVALQINFPTGFKFTSSSVPPAKNNNFWTLGKLPVGANGHIDITGSFIGQNLDQQILSGQLGLMISGNFAPQLLSTATFKLKNAPIAIVQQSSVTDAVNVGDTIQFTINYENKGTVGLTNLIIIDSLASSLIDTTRLNVPDAVVTGSTITWRAATNTNLSILTPGQTGQVQFSLPLKQNLPATIKNQVIKSSITVTSSEITTPIRAADLSIPLATKFAFDITGDLVAGSIPMKVGKSSTFAITWLLTNTSNDVNNTEVVASLPLQPSAWNNVIIPDAEKSRLSFDPSSGKIRWIIGDLPAFTGKLTPVAKVTFQLVVIPGPSDYGQTMKLLSNIQASAVDSFTNLKLNPTTIDQYTTSDVDDPQLQNAGSSVQQ